MTLIPSIVSPASEPPVWLDDVKRHIPGVTFDDDDARIGDLIIAAAALLDGWRGMLGRAIMPQTWRVRVDAAGEYVLPMPDVTEARAAYDDGSSEVLDVVVTARGWRVVAAGAGSIEFDCAMPETLMPAVRAAIYMLVRHWYDVEEWQAEKVAPLHFDSVIRPLRWSRI